jgi:hypothetical protein
VIAVEPLHLRVVEARRESRIPGGCVHGPEEAGHAAERLRHVGAARECVIQPLGRPEIFEHQHALLGIEVVDLGTDARVGHERSHGFEVACLEADALRGHLILREALQRRARLLQDPGASIFGAHATDPVDVSIAGGLDAAVLPGGEQPEAL